MVVTSVFVDPLGRGRIPENEKNGQTPDPGTLSLG